MYEKIFTNISYRKCMTEIIKSNEHFVMRLCTAFKLEKPYTKIEIMQSWVSEVQVIDNGYECRQIIDNGMASLSQWWLAFTLVRGPSQCVLLLLCNFWEWREK